MDPMLAHLAVDVVLGLQSPHRLAVADLVARRPHTTLHNPLSSLAGLIARADLAIGAGGSTTWERACLGLPSVVVSIADNQLAFAQALDQANYLHLLGDAASVTLDSIRSALRAALQAQWPRNSGSCLTDGWGAARLATALLGPELPIQLRPATANDEALLQRWGNQSQVCVNSSSNSLVVPADHQRWFHAGLADANRVLMIASDASGCPLGQIRFDRLMRDDAKGSHEALIHLSLDRCVRGHGLATGLIRQGLQEMERNWGPSTEAVADVHDGNVVIQATFSRADFVIEAPSSSLSMSRPAAALAPCSVTLLSDASSWLNDHLPRLIKALWVRGHSVRWIHKPADLAPGDVCLLLSCSRLLSADQLTLHRHNLVVHESDLPQGQGWSPMTWQILEGSNQIPVTLFEATNELDAGAIYLQRMINLHGAELVDEWRLLQAEITITLCLEWIDCYFDVIANARPQQGGASHYRRRRPADSQLDPNGSLADQFNLLRVVDNRRYPALVKMRGEQYELLIQPLGSANTVEVAGNNAANGCKLT